MCYFNAGLLECPADGAPMAAEGGGKLISAGSCAVSFCDLLDLAVAQTFLLLLIGIDFRIGIIGLVGYIRIDIGFASGIVRITESEVLPAIFEYTRGRVETRSQKCHQNMLCGCPETGCLFVLCEVLYHEKGYRCHAPVG